MKCPFCGAPESDYPGVYSCNSVSQNGITKEHMRGVDCLRSERNRLADYIKYLQEAFDAAEGVIKTTGCGCPYGDEEFYCSRCVEAGNRYYRAKLAKEAYENKPGESTIECLTSSTATKIHVALLDKEAE